MNLIFFRKFPKRVLVLVVGILALLLLSGGVFLFLNREIKGKPSDYVIKDTVQGKIIENKRAGFSAQVPDQWEAKRIEVEEGSAVLTTPIIEGVMNNNIVSPPLNKGCGIEFSVVYEKFSLKEIEEKVRSIHWGLEIKSEKFEEVLINGQLALKNDVNNGVMGSMISIYIPKGKKLYDFDLYWGFDDKEECIQEFNKFLETVVID
jgi:hypothetical protein